MLNWNDPDDEPTLVLHTLASIELSPIAIVEETTPVPELVAILVELRVPVLAVIDAAQQLRGLVTRTDVLGAAPDAETAADVMSGYVLALPLDATLERAAALMAMEGVGQVVVMTTSGEVAGVLSALDVARHVAQCAGYLAA